jgi:hypothetical protein
MRIVLLSAVLFSSLFYSCQKEFHTDPISEGPSSLIVQGIVTDAAGRPLKDVTIGGGNKQTLTDKNGAFRITDASFSTKEAFIKASKAGYFDGSRTFFSRSGSNNFVRIQLMQQDNGSTVTASSGGSVTIGGGAVVELPANGLITSDGSIYPGIVTVKAFYLNPHNRKLNQLMPGDLRGENSLGQLKGLKTFGMMAVELTGSSGQKLQIKNGSSAKLHFPVQNTNAPSSVPLWYFNDSTGLWKEEGFATRQGGEYVGNVKHFTFWNVDQPFDYVTVSMRVVNASQQPLSGLAVQLTSLSDSTAAYDYTDDNGYIDGYVPANTVLLREVLDDCGNVIASSQIGPYATNTTLGDVTVNNNPSLQTITGTVVNCSGNPIADGSVMLSMQGITQWAMVTNGAFNITFSNCSGTASASLIAEDNVTQQQGDPVLVSFSSGNVNAGQLQACGYGTASFIKLIVNGVTQNWNANPYLRYGAEDSSYIYPSGNYNLEIIAVDTSTFLPFPNFRLEIERPFGLAAAPSRLPLVNFDVDDPAIPASLNAYYEPIVSDSTTITQYGQVGQFITGSFSGMFQRSNNQTGVTDTVNVTCTYKVRRQQ